MDSEFQAALAAHQLGRLEEAAALYHRVLKRSPEHADSLHLLGVIANQTQKPANGVKWIEQAIRLAPPSPLYLTSLGNSQRMLGRLSDAEAKYRQALSYLPTFAEAWNALAGLLIECERWPEAEQASRKAIAMGRPNLAAYLNLGTAQLGLDLHREAEAAFQQALSFSPNCSEAAIGLARSRLKQERSLEAQTPLLQYLHDCGPHPLVLNELGSIALANGHRQFATDWFLKAIASDDSCMVARCNLAKSYQENWEFERAAHILQEGLSIHREHPDLLFLLAIVYQTAGQFLQADQVYAKLQCFYTNDREVDLLSVTSPPPLLRPSDLQRLFEVCVNRAQTKIELEEFDAACKLFQASLKIKPQSLAPLSQLVFTKQKLCDWDELETLSERLVSLIRGEFNGIDHVATPWSLLSLPVQPKVELEAKAVQRYCETIPKHTFVQRLARPRLGEQRIRIAYLSSDFQDHPVAHAMLPLLTHRDREKFEVAVYSLGKRDESAIANQIASLADSYYDGFAKPTSAIVASLAAGLFDVLIDLNGYTKNARTEILASRPVGRQLHFLGYAGSVGTSFYNAMIVDNFIVPSDSVRHYREELLRLPNCFLPPSQFPSRGEAPNRETLNLPENSVVLAAFHPPYKITRHVFHVWMKLLAELPNTTLWLSSITSVARANLQRQAQSAGVDPKRLIFAERLQSREEHLLRLRAADVFLDTFPYGGHTTAADFIRSSVPTVTVCGETIASRVAGSLLTHLGQSQMITESVEDYFALAYSLASKTEFRSAAKESLCQSLASTVIFDPVVYTRGFETTLTNYLRKG